MNKIEKKLPPSVLYKYRCFKRCLSIIKENEIYFSFPNNLNDPFECLSIIDIKDYEKEKLLEKEIFKKIQEECERYRREEYNNHYTFFSLSEVRDSILLFSHYSTQHQGVCIGFDTTKYPFKDASVVEYKNNLPRINLSDSSHSDIINFAPFLTKAKVWEYEKEWRIINYEEECRINKDENKVLKFEGIAIKEIILGCKISPKDKKDLLDIIKEKKLKISIFQAKQKKYQYALELEEIPLYDH